MLKKTHNKFKKNKKGLSEMVAYVILISIAMGLAVAIFAWLRIVAGDTQEIIDCPEGTSVYIESYKCSDVAAGGELPGIELVIGNNGRFNVDGVIVKVGNDPGKEPIIFLKANYHGTTFRSDVPGHFSFLDSNNMGLKPGDSQIVKFTNQKYNDTIKNYFEYDEGTVNITSIQPFMFKKRKITCIGTTITEPIEGCKIK